MTPAQIHAFFAALQAANPQPQTELEYTSVFELLTAVLLSAQATDVGVNKATRRLFLVANTPQAIIDLGPERLEGYIKTIGLYRSKARHLMATCHILVEQHGGVVPRTCEALEQLPGVGRKNRQRGAERGLWPAHHGGGHAPVPRQQPHRPGAGQNAAGRRKAAVAARARPVRRGRPPLADFAGPLRLPSAQTTLLGMRGRPTLRF